MQRYCSRLTTIEMGRKLGVCPHFREGYKRGPHLTQIRLVYGVTSIPSGILIHPAIWQQQIWAKIQGGEVGPYLTQCGQGWGLPACQVLSWSVQPFGHNTPTSQTDRYTGQTDRQRTDSIGRTVLQVVAQKPEKSTPISWYHYHRIFTYTQR